MLSTHSAGITDAVSTGRITPSEGSELTSVVEAHARAINDADVELRMDNLEKKVQQIISELEDKLKSTLMEFQVHEDKFGNLKGSLLKQRSSVAAIVYQTGKEQNTL